MMIAAVFQQPVKLMAKDMILTATINLVFTGFVRGLWIYRSIGGSAMKLKKVRRTSRRESGFLCWRLRGMMNSSQFLPGF